MHDDDEYLKGYPAEYYAQNFEETFSKEKFCEKFLGDLPLDVVQELLKDKYPENFI